MNKVPNHLPKSIDSGWSLQLYSGDRRLLCSLYPSHGWVFLAGICLGFLMAFISFGAQLKSPSSPSLSTPMEAPLNID
ncbi:MAG TPA: hypothetical protein IGS53_24865 [Leptolyngbyaceae cyanobacterium M33_DOE_097]|uniref:Uncharacterized protein n=1 Tax=Oscillatoriales cyanobacterium SpSt-418 TaxID=2282169 RepID=A0A7C3KG31_9CYAN|nr:hypothetical protein [Leptolyngbyaceae cyanobacterium M33_DOE_097]